MIRLSTCLPVVILGLWAPAAAAQDGGQKPPPQVWPDIGITAYSPPPAGQGDTSMSNVEAPDFLRRVMPDGDVRDWIAEDDPIMAMVVADDASPARSAFVFDIGPDGRVTGCTLETHRYTPTNPYTDGLCERMSERMRFRPALNPQGEPTADRYFAYVWFDQSTRQRDRRVNHQSLPPAPAPGPGRPRLQPATATSETLDRVRTVVPESGSAPARLRLEIDATGAVSQCLVTTSSGQDATDVALCRLMLEQARFTPAQEASGRPRASTLYNWTPPAK